MWKVGTDPVVKVCGNYVKVWKRKVGWRGVGMREGLCMGARRAAPPADTRGAGVGKHYNELQMI